MKDTSGVMMQRLANQLVGSLRTLLRRGALFLLATVAAGSLTLTPVLSPTANAQGISDLLSLTNFTNGLSSCAIETVGWVICPTMRSIARLADYGFTYINQSFLKIDYNIAANNSGTYKAWQMMETIANALFVVAFMILVYSQLTGKGGGYNMKRMLPRLIIAAILVNVSYYLCVAIIDVSNILGDSILSALTGVAGRVGHSVMPIGKSASAFQDGTLTTITSSIMNKPGLAWVLLAPVAAVVISIATICAAGVVLLIMRKTVVAMLILASPVLFVAYLLPNLEKYFFQGMRLFMQLLLLYPIIALLLGAGQIVSATIVTVGSNDANYRVSGDSYFSSSGGSGSAITDLTAAAAAVMPLLAVWFIFKNMSSIMSTAGTRLSASIAGRRGGKDDEKARVTGNATAGAAAKNNAGNVLGPMNRRQAYSRNRRRASLGGSSLPFEEQLGGGAAGNRAGAANQPNLGAANPFAGGQSEDEKKRLEELQSARLDGEAAVESADAGDIAKALSASELQTQQKEEEKHVTAKDIFNSLNKGGGGHESKDKERKFSSGPAPAGGGGGGGSSASNQPSAPTVSYRAPQIAQGGNIISGGSAPQQTTKIIAVPVQVDASALLGQNQNQNQHHPPENIAQPPISGTEEKAKARAQKYLFDAEKDLNSARDAQDILGHKEPALTEQPHTAVKTDDKKGSE